MIGKLGRLPKKADPRTLQLARYLSPTLPPIHLSTSWARLATGDPPMFANDRIGDCTVAALAHSLRICSSAAGNQIVVSDADVLKVYSAISGYDPDDPSTDRGAYCLDALKYVRTHGLGGHKIRAFAEIDPTDLRSLYATIDLFGTAYGGYGLPRSAQSQLVWDLSSGPDAAPWSWGGHAMSETDHGPFAENMATWGRLQTATRAWGQRYREESYAVIWDVWVPPAGLSPSGFDLAQMLEDLEAVTR